MSNYSIDIKHTNRKNIVKFEANKFLFNDEAFELNNIDEAKNAPLAQQLFYLPFVKKVYMAQNFIAVEKYDIVEWDAVEGELAEQIQTYLNEGKPLIINHKPSQNVAVTVYAESTPNPGVMKFVANKKLVLQSFEFKNIDETAISPLAQALFHFPFIKELYFDENYISIQKYDIAEWNDITMELREFIRNYIQEGKTIIAEEKLEANKNKATETKVNIENLDDTSKEIVAILDEYVKPAVANDGGNILFDSYNPETQTVKVILQGACSGCPSSTITLKNGIETMLRDMMQGKVNHVEAVNS